MTLECDVLVVGAGPAGSTAALKLSKLGLNTVLLEKNTKVGSHTKLKIDVSPEDNITEIVNELNLKTAGYGTKSKWYSPNNKYFLYESVEDGEYYFKRGPSEDSFDCTTVEAAVDNGCNLFLNAKIKKIGFKQKKIVEVKLSDGRVFKPDFVIDATGAGSNLLQRSYKGKKKSTKLSLCLVSGNNFDLVYGTTEVFFNKEYLPHGYAYMAKSVDDICTAGVVFDPMETKYSSKMVFERFAKLNEAFRKKINPNNVTIASGYYYTTPLRKFVYGNLLLVGDAAHLADPFLGYGMRPAILSGYLAAKTCSGALEFLETSLKEYESICKEKLRLKESIMLRRAFWSLDNDEIDILIGLLNQIKNSSAIDVILKNNVSNAAQRTRYTNIITKFMELV